MGAACRPTRRCRLPAHIPRRPRCSPSPSAPSPPASPHSRGSTSCATILQVQRRFATGRVQNGGQHAAAVAGGGACASACFRIGDRARWRQPPLVFVHSAEFLVHRPSCPCDRHVPRRAFTTRVARYVQASLRCAVAERARRDWERACTRASDRLSASRSPAVHASLATSTQSIAAITAPFWSGREEVESDLTIQHALRACEGRRTSSLSCASSTCRPSST